MVSRLVREFQPDSIYLFGSVARGEAGADSDYDLMVVTGEGAPVQVRQEPRYRRAQRALWGLAAGADVLVLTREEFDESASVVSSLPATVMREGKALYAA